MRLGTESMPYSLASSGLLILTKAMPCYRTWKENDGTVENQHQIARQSILFLFSFFFTLASHSSSMFSSSATTAVDLLSSLSSKQENSDVKKTKKQTRIYQETRAAGRLIRQSWCSFVFETDTLVRKDKEQKPEKVGIHFRSRCISHPTTGIVWL